MTTQTSQHTESRPYDERILVVKRAHLFANGPWEGVNIEQLVPCIEAIGKHSEFHLRSLMEQDPTYKQIIPYLVFQYQDKFFIMQRKKEASEQRLQSKYSLGIGGHMRYEDLQQGADLFSWARREFEEEVAYEGNIEIAPLGVLNDDSNEVGKVHLGLVFMVIGDSDNIKVKSELASGTLMTLSECLDYVPKMETWSQMVLMTLLKEGMRFAQETPDQQQHETCGEDEKCCE